MLKKFRKPEIIFTIIVLIFSIILFLIPTGFEKESDGYLREKGLIIATDNSKIVQSGIVKTGTQGLRVKILTGKFKGQEFESSNLLVGRLEIDKMFEPGDKALITINHSGNKIIAVNVIDHYRINYELILFSIFVLLLIYFGGWIGAKALLSFVFTVLMMWKILLPAFLKGFNPVIISFIVVVVLAAVTIFLVAGISKKAVTAFLGTISGVITTLIFSLLFGNLFKIHGAVVPFSETLLYSGYAHLNLTQIFLSSIFIASVGALMDIAMDISAAIQEVVEKKPDITSREAIQSGFNVGRVVIGTMTTTLLFAYSGGYIALLMVFMAQGTPVINILNLQYVAAQILHTLVGSFGMIIVAPFTAILGGLLFTFKTKRTVSS
ncbi:YibE/F family protein [Aceticella autotrophica]|uniref:YibE/F family protein n=1 Tax=Aceticella autotrophica TaxID=2755338 RepID=A0A975GAP9_9THEO|nr:YibE/F family protein [Aceticella autotrophica]QSZ27638.1 YibE/F family protein [Aceticella autotrophica]